MARFVGIVGLVALTLVLPLSSLTPLSSAVSIPVGRIAYIGTDDQLHVMNADGSGDMIIPTRGKPSSPRWSPRTGEIAFAEELSTAPASYQVSVVNPAASSTRVLVIPEIARTNPDQYFALSHVRWTPDGSAVLYRKNGGNRVLQSLMRVDAAGGTPQSLNYACTTCGFDISPTDGRVAMVENGLDQQAGSSRLLVFDLDGGNVRVVLPYGNSFYSSPSWTPDGRFVAVVQSVTTAQTPRLVLIDPGTGTERFLLGGPSVGGSGYTFSPDGKTFVFSDGANKRLTLYNIGDRLDAQEIGAGTMPSFEAGRFFAQTGFTVIGRFLGYWQANGGLPINGYPISDAFTERLEDGREYTVQYFERVRMEYHPANPPPNDVLLGQFGRRIRPADPPVPPLTGAAHFPETGHNVEGRFLEYWQTNGSLRQFGFPISEVFTERLEDGNAYRVQYFERARFEYHPEGAPPNDVLLGQFGRRVYNER